MKTIIKIGILILLFSSMGAGCEKDSEQLLHNITLYDKPLSVIQKYITGKWKLQYAFGGLWAHKVINTDNSYMILSPNHIIKGNDSRGDRKSTRLNSSHTDISRMPSSA